MDRVTSMRIPVSVVSIKTSCDTDTIRVTQAEEFSAPFSSYLNGSFERSAADHAATAKKAKWKFCSNGPLNTRPSFRLRRLFCFPEPEKLSRGAVCECRDCVRLAHPQF